MTVVLLFALSLLHGVFASGFIPILRAYAKQQAPLAFALYFGGQVLGQLLVATVGALRRHRLLYPAYEAAFGLSLLAMGLFFHLAPASLVVGRGLEGLTAGLAVPLLFQCVAAAPALGRAERRIALFNSLFAVGFVVGPPLVSLALARLAPAHLLFGFGGTFVAVAAAIAPLVGASPEEPRTMTRPSAGWMDTFYLLFLGKCAYGFILPFTTKVLADRMPIGVSAILLLLSATFIVGQFLGGAVARRFRGPGLRLFLPLSLAPFVVAMAIPGLEWSLFAGGLLHSVLMFVALLAFAETPANARQFALLSSLSDPGLVVGAALAGLDAGGIAGVVVLCLVPLAMRISRRSVK